MLPKDYASHVFINCPFDKQYQPIREAIIFAIFDCGFIPRSVLEENNSSDVRFEKIKHLISISKFGVHDISRTSLDSRNKLPRFNMPLELGVFIGAKKFGENYHRQKDIMILDKEAYRYQVFISDLAGQDIQAHNNDPAEAINKIRDWLNNASIADINIKATTTEKMGFVGAGEGIAVHAVVLLNEC